MSQTSRQSTNKFRVADTDVNPMLLGDIDAFLEKFQKLVSNKQLTKQNNLIQIHTTGKSFIVDDDKKDDKKERKMCNVVLEFFEFDYQSFEYKKDACGIKIKFTVKGKIEWPYTFIYNENDRMWYDEPYGPDFRWILDPFPILNFQDQ